MEQSNLPSLAAGGRPLPLPSPAASEAHHTAVQDSLPQVTFADPFLPATSAFSSASTAVVPLLADRISLPQQLNIVPMLSVLPPAIADRYTEAASPSLLRSDMEVFVLNHLDPLKPARVAGSRAEYVKLVGRMFAAERMVAFTDQPKSVNGVFAVAKDAESDRLIIDAQPCNRLFVDSPHVALPGPSHLVQMHVPNGAIMFVGKSDLSNYYHHIRPA